jgi:GT2 family glycosyltransferase
VTVIVAVHDALEHVRACLSSIVEHTLPPYELLLVDDGSQAETAEYLRRFAVGQDARLIRNATARGYTAAANQGFRAARGEYVVLLNSDTVVSADWLDRLVMCAESDPRIGLVGPLSNTASWQSVPEVEQQGDWAPNPLPAGWTAGDMARAVAAFAGRTYPRMSFLNGFCLLVKRAVIDAIGDFDEAAFGEGYGEENDYCLRARAAGWELALADDVWVHHAQGQSYARARRLQLYENASRALHAKHDPALILEGVRQCRDDLALVAIRARVAQLAPRRALIERGRQLWEGRRVAFVLPIREVGGGANVVLAEARAMRRFGVDVLIVNLEAERAAFFAGYPDLDLRVSFAPAAADVVELVRDYDAAVATAYHSVFWLAPLRQAGRSPRLGYYVQDFEPLFFAAGTAEYRSALSSYTAVPDIVLFTKTAWNRDELRRAVGVEAAVVGASCDIDLFRPGPAAADGRLRLCAMIRPSSARRGARETMELLAEVDRRYGERVDIHLFGVEPWDPLFHLLPRGFRWQQHGVLAPEATAGLLATQDVFVDLSRYQAMGLTAMEAMSSGLGVVVPRAGGATSFAADGRNALVVDTSSRDACLAAVVSLIEDPELLSRLRSAATRDIVEHFPERAAFQVLSALFGAGPPCRP